MPGSDSGEPVTRILRGDDARWFTYVPIDIDGKRRGAIELSETATSERRFATSTIVDTLALATALALVGAMLSFALGQWLVGSPIRALAEKARRIGRGDFGAPLLLERDDEFAELGREMNGMCERLSTTLEQLRHADRLATVGKLASGIAHELGTPLNVVSVRADMIARGETTPEESRDYARVIVGGATRMTKIIRQLLQFARRSGPKKSELRLRDLADDTVALLHPLAEKQNVRFQITTAGPRSAALRGRWPDPAGAHEPPHQRRPGDAKGGLVRISCGVERAHPPPDVGAAEGEYASVSVGDEGEGIRPAPAPRLRALLHHEGCRGRDRLGARGLVWDHPRPRRLDLGRERAGKGNHVQHLLADVHVMRTRVLVVDDDTSLSETLALGLTRRGYAITTAASAADALVSVAKDEIDVVLTDLSMREVSGIELCERIADDRRDIPVIMLTAFGSLDTAVAAIRAGAYDFITKPVELDALTIAIDRAARAPLAPRAGQAPQPCARAHAALRRARRRELGDAEACTISSSASPIPTRRCSSRARAGRARSSSPARSTHGAAARDGPFVAINCAAMPEHAARERALRTRQGRVHRRQTARAGPLRAGRAAARSSSTRSASMPARRCRPSSCACSRSARSAASAATSESPFDVRVIAATNRDLEAAVEESASARTSTTGSTSSSIDAPAAARAAGRHPACSPSTSCERFAKRTGKRVDAASRRRGRAAHGLHVAGQRARAAELRSSGPSPWRASSAITADDLPEKVRDYRRSHVRSRER